MSQSCNNGLLTDKDIEYLSENCTVASCIRNNSRGINYFFPHLTSTCNGSLVNWTVSGHLSYGDIATNPTLTIWRMSPQSNGKFTIQQTTSLTYCNGNRMDQMGSQVYKCKLQNRLPVQDGDVIGMEIPYFDSSADTFSPYFDKSSDGLPKINFVRGTSISTLIPSMSRSARSLPLLSVGVVPHGKLKLFHSILFEC